MTRRCPNEPGRRLARLASLPTGLACLAMSGCMTMSGLSGSSRYACDAPEGVACESVSATFARATRHALPARQLHGDASGIQAPPPRAPDLPDASPLELYGAASGAASGAANGAADGAASEADRNAIAASGQPDADRRQTPLRSSARILRLWFKPWEDADGDLYDQGHVYVQVEDGRWLVDHAQRRIREAYAPLRPPPRSTEPATGTRNPSSPVRPAGPQAFPGAPSPVDLIRQTD